MIHVKVTDTVCVLLSDQRGYYAGQPGYPTQPGYPPGPNQSYLPPYTPTPGFVAPPPTAPPYGQVPLSTGQPYGTTHQEAMYGTSYAQDDPITERVENFEFSDKSIRRGFIR